MYCVAVQAYLFSDLMLFLHGWSRKGSAIMAKKNLKKDTDKDVFAKLEDEKILVGDTFADFRKQFDEYQHAKTSEEINLKPVNRPYLQAFH